MNRRGWIGAAMLVLVGCGGKVVYEAPPLEEQPPLVEIKKPYTDPLPHPTATSTGKPPPPPPPPHDPAPPPKDPNPLPDEPAPIVLPFVCRTIQTDASGVHLASLTFAFGAGQTRVVLGPALALSVAAASSITALGRQGEYLYTCSAGTVARIALADASIETSTIACDAVTADDAAIWIQSSARGALDRYDDYAGVLAGRVSATFAPMPSTVIGVQGGVVIAAVDEPNPDDGAAVFQQILRLDTATGARSSVDLFVSGRQRGIDLASDGYTYFADDGYGYGRISTKQDGAWANSDAPGAELHGIICQ